MSHCRHSIRSTHLIAVTCAVLLLVAFAPSIAHGEHRVALLISIGQYEDERLATSPADLNALAASLEKYGVRSQVVMDLDGDKLTAALDQFAASTPTRGTALVYFSGQVLPGNHKGRDGTFLAGTDAKSGDLRSIGNAGYRVEQLLERLNDKGGASCNLVLLSPAHGELEYQRDLPTGALVGSADAKSLAANLSGKGNLLAEIRAACSSVATSLAADVSLTGRGTSVVSSPDRFVPGRRAGDEWVNSRGTVFCWCPPGSFLMGSPENEPERYPDETQHEVRIEHGFWIGKYELTLRENLRNHPRKTIAKHKLDPLTMIHLDDGRQMLRTLTSEEQEQGRLANDWEYALPNEQQWEYAARAGTSSRWYFGDDLKPLPLHANFGDKSYYDSRDIYSNAAHRTLDDGAVQLALVGSYRPNPWGLHDVYGNVAEWCADTATRGGSWVSRGIHCRSAYRDYYSSRNEENFIGYRVVIRTTSGSRP